jgi:hypothetical protein
MSSLKSRTAPSFAEHEEPLRAALVEVAENSFFAFAAGCDPDQFADLARTPPVFDPDAAPGPQAWLVTTVRFSGAFAGHVEVAMSEPLARQLFAAFLGLGPDEEMTAAQVADSTGEFGNQVCGTWLTRACQDRRFDLKPPEVVHRPAPWLPLDAPPSGDHDGQVLVTLNDLPLRLRIHFDPELV